MSNLRSPLQQLGQSLDPTVAKCLVCGVRPGKSEEHFRTSQFTLFNKWKKKCCATVSKLLPLNSSYDCYEFFLENSPLCELCLEAFREIEMSLFTFQETEKRLLRSIRDIRNRLTNHFDSICSPNESINSILNERRQHIESILPHELVKWKDEMTLDDIVCFLGSSK